VPQPKLLRVRAEGADVAAMVDRWTQSLDGVARGEPADVRLGVAPASDADASLATVRWLPPPPGKGTGRREGGILAGRHPLVEGLAWAALVAPEAPVTPPAPGDTVLVWQGTRPLVFLRGPRHLHLDFPLEGSNALRLPATVVLLHRFLETVRAEIVREEHANLECGQRLAVGIDAAGSPLRLAVDGDAGLGGEARDGLRAPWRPAFFRVTRGAELVLAGAAHFADVREADFTHAASGDLRPADRRESRDRQRREDPWLPFWIVLLGATLVADWTWAEGRA
jgi:hypothetical protein